MAFYLRNIQVSEKFAEKAPRYGVIHREESSFKDQDGNLHVAYIVRWYEGDYNASRIGAFDITTGEYLGEVMK